MWDEFCRDCGHKLENGVCPKCGVKKGISFNAILLMLMQGLCIRKRGA